VHQFDSVDVTNAQWGEPWKLSQGEGSWGVKDRISATLVSRRMNWGRGANAGRMPTFSDTFGGFVLSPALLSGDGGLLCSYDHDGGTMQRKCNPVGVSSRCIPGCYREGVNGGSVWCRRGWTEWPCAFRPGDLSLMLETQRNNAKWKAGDPQQWYNELILSERSYSRALPSSIQAVFYIRARTCHSENWAAQGDKCESYARAMHARLTRHFGLTAEQLPLLRLDLRDFDTPFSADSKL